MTTFTLISTAIVTLIALPLVAGLLGLMAQCAKGRNPGAISLGLVALGVGQLALWAIAAQVAGTTPQDIVLRFLM
jgi:hypothetical protein